MTSIPVIRTVEQLKEVYAEYCNGFRTDAAKEIPNVRFSKLTGEQKAYLSEYTATESFACLVDFNVPGMIEFVLGLEEFDGTAPIFATYDGKSYSAKRNTHNRRKTNSRIGPTTKNGTYSNSMVRSHWITNWNDPGLVCVFAFIRSFQHRADAIMLARNELAANGGKLPLFPMVFGIPPQFADMTDKAKSRNAKDDDFCDTEQFPYELLQRVQTELTGEPMPLDDLVSVRLDCIALRQKFLGTLAQRLRGSDVSKTGDKLDDDSKNDLLDRLGGSLVVDEFIAKIYESQRSASGKLDRTWTELFSPAIVATGLVLACNSSERIGARIDETIVRKPDETPEEYTERKLEYKSSLLSGEIQIDNTFVDEFLKTFAESTPELGTFATVFADLFKRKSSEKKGSGAKNLFFEPLSKPSMSAFVSLVQNYLANDLSSSVWTVYKNIGSSEKPEYSPEYRCFGGLDVGYTKRGKKSE